MLGSYSSAECEFAEATVPDSNVMVFVTSSCYTLRTGGLNKYLSHGHVSIYSCRPQFTTRHPSLPTAARQARLPIRASAAAAAAAAAAKAAAAAETAVAAAAAVSAVLQVVLAALAAAAAAARVAVVEAAAARAVSQRGGGGGGGGDGGGGGGGGGGHVQPGYSRLPPKGTQTRPHHPTAGAVV